MQRYSHNNTNKNGRDGKDQCSYSETIAYSSKILAEVPNGPFRRKAGKMD